MTGGPALPDWDHDAHIGRAIALSRERMEAGAGGPFGAVVVAENRVIGEGWNQVTSALDPTAHAEMVAIRAACRAVGDFALRGAVLYTSCEPCPMCLAATYWARIRAIVYANDRADAAAIGFDDAFLYREVALPLADRSVPLVRRRAEEGRRVFDAWSVKADRVAY